MAIFILIFLFLLIVYSLLIDYYRRSWNLLPSFSIGGENHVNISVVIAVRNEEMNIGKLIEALKQQDYPANMFEVIIVDDHSDDEAWTILSAVGPTTFKLLTLQLPEGIFGKKKAIELGIQSANGDLIITTDADCQVPERWISSFASFHRNTAAKFIAAPVKMDGGNSLLHILQSLDFLALQAVTGAAVNKKFHMMCNGASLAYEKKVFMEVGGFDGIDEIPSGDDMLLMYKIFKRYPDGVYYMKCNEAIVSTSPEQTWKDFFQQRIRWASKAVHFNDNKIFYALLVTYLVNVFFIVLACLSIFKFQWFAFLLLLLLAKILIEFPFVNSAAIFFRQERLMRFFVFVQPVHIVYTAIAGWLGRFGSYRWKSRTIKNKGRRKLVKQ